MLTDYHTHLRPDALDTPPERYFTEGNLERYLEAAAARGIGELGFSEHVYRFREALDIWRHPFWEECATDSLDEYVEFLVERGPCREGRPRGRLDPGPGGADRGVPIDGRPWDYIIGSVHFISDRAVDHDGYDIWISSSPDEVWAAYFEALGDAAASGLFDVLAHPDLVKVWGKAKPDPPRPSASTTSSRWSKSPPLTSRSRFRRPGCASRWASSTRIASCSSCACEAGKPVSLSSDAHEPRVHRPRLRPRGRADARCGIDRVSVFEGRRRREVALG